jgi:hypothetical protein
MPVTIPDQVTSIADVLGCTTNDITLGGRAAAETGSIRTCTKAGCLFGPPVPVANVFSPATSHCMTFTLTQDASGTASCATGSMDMALSLTADIHLTGDAAPAVSGIQPCPICSAGSCIGGPNDGMTCTPASSDLGDAYPTSHDCPPDPMLLLDPPPPLDLVLSTDTVTWTATPATNDAGSPSSPQLRVFSGYCRDDDGTGQFQSPAKHCWENGMAVGTPCAGTFETCEQRNTGAFGPNGGAVRTISVVGTSAGSLADNAPHAATLGSIFSVGPTLDGTVDSALDLPGPGAIALEGTVQVQ